MLRGFWLKRLIRDEVKWRQMAIKMVSKRAHQLLKALEIEVQYNYSHPDLFSEGKNYFMVCNHMSYLDIVLLSAGEPAVFVTSIEMKNTPVLGEISAYGGSFFVERRERSKIPGEVRELAGLLHKGFQVFVFPEATSSHGMNVLPFKRALFSAALEAEANVLPVCLRIEEINGEPFSEKNHDLICWYGDADFFSHFRRLMTINSLKVTVNYLEPIMVKQFPDRYSLSEQSYKQITDKYFANRPPEFKPWPLPEKKDQAPFSGSKI
jgi:lyso-ornithine lipid O-acyltransferase